MLSATTPGLLATHVGSAIVAPLAVTIDQTLIADFCALSGDHQWIHRTDESAIAPGNLLIALIPRFVQSAIHVERYAHCVTAGYECIRFVEPVLAGQSVAMTVTLVSVKTRPPKSYVKVACQLRVGDRAKLQATLIDVYTV